MPHRQGHLSLRRGDLIEAFAHTWQRQPQSDSRGKAIRDVLERASLSDGFVDRRRIVETPVDALRIARKDRARLRGAIAHGNHEIKILPHKPIQVLGNQAPCIDTEFFL